MIFFHSVNPIDLKISSIPASTQQKLSRVCCFCTNEVLSTGGYFLCLDYNNFISIFLYIFFIWCINSAHSGTGNINLLSSFIITLSHGCYCFALIHTCISLQQIFPYIHSHIYMAIHTYMAILTYMAIHTCIHSHTYIHGHIYIHGHTYMVMVFRAVVLSSLLYACETWTLYSRDVKQLEKF